MRKSHFSEAQIVAILREFAAGSSSRWPWPFACSCKPSTMLKRWQEAVAGSKASLNPTMRVSIL
jgi:hypothetical protein